jgi:hypothetical protein
VPAVLALRYFFAASTIIDTTTPNKYSIIFSFL